MTSFIRYRRRMPRCPRSAPSGSSTGTRRADRGVGRRRGAASDPGSDYLGAVSVAGAVREADFFNHLGNTQGVGFYLAFMAAGIHARYPEFEPRDLLSDEVLAHYDDVTTKGCFYYAYATFAWRRAVRCCARTGRRTNGCIGFSRAISLGTAPIGGPMLIIAGEGDQTFRSTACAPRRSKCAAPASR